MCSALSPQSWESLAAKKALLCQHFQHLPSALRCHQQISAGSQSASRQQAGPAEPPGLAKLQQECPWFRDATWGNLQAYLLHAAESISGVSWMQGGKLSHAETISTKPFLSRHHICFLTGIVKLPQYQKPGSPTDRLFFADWYIGETSLLCFTLLFSLVSKQLWKLCGFQPFRGIFCV